MAPEEMYEPDPQFTAHYGLDGSKSVTVDRWSTVLRVVPELLEKPDLEFMRYDTEAGDPFITVANGEAKYARLNTGLSMSGAVRFRVVSSSWRPVEEIAEAGA